MLVTLAEGALIGTLTMMWIVCNMLIIDTVRSNRQSWNEFVKDSQGSKIGQILMTTFYCIAAVITF